MKNQRLIAAFSACVAITLLANTSTTMAQTKVAIVDIGLIFKSHPEFSQRLAALKQDADQFQQNAMAAQQQLMQKAEVLKQYTPGSEEFKSYESTLAQQKAAMDVDQRNRMRTLMQEEAKLHFNTYAEVNELVSQYSSSQGIQLVLRYNSQKMDPKNPNSVMQRVNGSVIYHAPGNDITELIVNRIAQLKNTANAGTLQERR